MGMDDETKRVLKDAYKHAKIEDTHIAWRQLHSQLEYEIEYNDADKNDVQYSLEEKALQGNLEIDLGLSEEAIEHMQNKGKEDLEKKCLD